VNAGIAETGHEVTDGEAFADARRGVEVAARVDHNQTLVD
jgi:hypothetical protein